MKSVFYRSIMILVVLMLISSTSFANLKKARVGAGASKAFEMDVFADGISLISLIYDAAASDLDLAVGLEDGTLVGGSISAESFQEVLQLGLVGNTTFLVVVNSFEGPATTFRLVANSGEQQTLRAGKESLREVEMNAAGLKLRDQLRKLSKIKK